MKERDGAAAIDRYMNRVFTWVILGYPCTLLLAGTVFTLLKGKGYYPEVAWKTLWIFDLSGLVYFGLCVVLNSFCREKGEGKQRALKPLALKVGKVLVAVMVLHEWNVIAYMFPTRDFWGYTLFFVTLATVFLDHRYLLWVMAGLLVSVGVSYLVKGGALLPEAGASYVPNMVLRWVLMGVFCLCSFLVTYLVETRLAAELEEMAERDELTGLYNRRGMERRLPGLVSAREGAPCGVAMCDLDDFKQVNDRFGHVCGDEMLRMVSSVVQAHLGDRGTAFRYGGEEILVFVAMDRQQAREVVDQFRQDLAESALVYKGEKIHATITVGLAFGTGKTPVKELIEIADRNLYRGKGAGKNRVVG